MLCSGGNGADRGAFRTGPTSAPARSRRSCERTYASCRYSLPLPSRPVRRRVESLRVAGPARWVAATAAAQHGCQKGGHFAISEPTGLIFRWRGGGALHAPLAAGDRLSRSRTNADHAQRNATSERARPPKQAVPGWRRNLTPSGVDPAKTAGAWPGGRAIQSPARAVQVPTPEDPIRLVCFDAEVELFPGAIHGAPGPTRSSPGLVLPRSSPRPPARTLLPRARTRHLTPPRPRAPAALGPARPPDQPVSRSRPPRYGRSAAGITTLPSACW